jgi:pilus assembly protein CpaF
MITIDKRITQFRAKLLEDLDLSKEVTDEEVLEIIDQMIIASSKIKFMSLNERSFIRMELFNSIRKLDLLQELIENPKITEIMVNGKDDIFIEQEGRVTRLDRAFSSEEALENVVQQIVSKCNRIVNEANPIVDARLENGDRVNIILPPIALNGPIITIRRFPQHPITMKQLIQMNSITEEAAGFLKVLVAAGYNIFISGGTGSGKTTFLNALSSFIPKDERIVTIEDNAELQIQGLENLVRLEARNTSLEGDHEITIRELTKTALRIRPSRIIIGEVRSGEAIDLLMAMNTGHNGSLSTGHANNGKDMFSRLETMVLMGIELPLEAIRRQISSGIDILVHLGRLRDKSRKVLEILEIIGMKEGEIIVEPIYLFEEKGENKNGQVQGRLYKQNNLFHRTKLLESGIFLEQEE